MKSGSRTHKLWLWWGDQSWNVANREISLPGWPWRVYCWLRGHRVDDDQCGKPEHRYCWVCWTSTPHAAIHAK